MVVKEGVRDLRDRVGGEVDRWFSVTRAGVPGRYLAATRVVLGALQCRVPRRYVEVTTKVVKEGVYVFRSSPTRTKDAEDACDAQARLSDQ